MTLSKVVPSSFSLKKIHLGKYMPLVEHYPEEDLKMTGRYTPPSQAHSVLWTKPTDALNTFFMLRRLLDKELPRAESCNSSTGVFK